ncbi:MAG: methyltransferase domain-containing protein [bacterium]|nr:methyltransferase domain-containing protein [bacterium]
MTFDKQQTGSLDLPQQAQEEEYILPYHWQWTPDSESGRVYFSYLKRIADLFPESARSFIDIGCGDGRSTVYLHDTFPDMHCVGLDYSDRALALATLMSGSRDIEWKRVDVCEALTAHEMAFDVVTAIEIFEHISKDKLGDALQNVRALLVPGGSLMCSVPSVNIPKTAKHYQHFTPESIRSYLEEAGFRVAHLSGQQRHRHPLFHIYRYFDNRFWTIKPLMRWFNRSLYPTYISQSALEKADRLIVKAVRDDAPKASV